MHYLASFGICTVLALGIGISGVQAASVKASSSLELIPSPQKVQLADSGFKPVKGMIIHVTDTSEDRFSARLLRDSFRAAYGVDTDISLIKSNPAVHELYLSKGEKFANEEVSLPAEAEKEGYNLNVTPSQVSIAGKTSTGVFYGVQTAIQMIEQSVRDKSPIPGAVITDWPSFGMRTLYCEGGQSKGSVIVTKEYLEQTIKRMARMKMNSLIIEIYNLVPFKSFPYCADADTLSLAEWNYLVELAHSYHVVLIPSIQSFAQMAEIIWYVDEGKPYQESTAPGMICPSRPENIKFLHDLYKDLMAVFKYSPMIGIGCSEVGMQWVERYCPLCKRRIDSGETLFDIYYKHVVACSREVDAVAKELGREVRPMMWADEFYMGYGGHRWVGIENIPHNVIMGHWKYWSDNAGYPDELKDYGTMNGLLDRGYDVIYLSASYNFNTYLVDLTPDDPKDGKTSVLCDGGLTNIAEQAKGALRHSKNSSAGKVLGGGCATFSQHDIRCWDTTWYAYAVNAEYTWSDTTRPREEIDRNFADKFAAVFYGARTRKAVDTIADAYRDLDAAKSDIERINYLIRDLVGEYDTQDASYIGNTLQESVKLIDELASKPQTPGKSLADISSWAGNAKKTALAYRNKLASVIPDVANTYSLEYLINAAHKIQNHAERTTYLLDQQSVLRNIDKQSGTKLKELQNRLASLREDTQTLADEADLLAWGRGANSTPWTRTGDATGYHQVLASLDVFQEKLSQAEKSLK